VALLGVLFRVEKIHWAAWMGILVSLAGLYLVIASGEGLRFSSRGAKGDLMILSGTVLWSLYTVFSKGFLDRLSPLKFTTITVFFGAMTYLPFSLGEIVAIPWSRVSWGAWGGLAFSAVFSLVLGYLVWYSSVQRVGNARTAIYSNLTPFVTAVFASLFLGETLGARKIIGGVIILAGVYLARSGYYHFLKCRPDVG
ncbi:MAG: DMT family transporter, partial [Candidatus Aminicenantes bacterium]|nr:DMT family transporter [Candidatus Aminicenantes bacterium]